MATTRLVTKVMFIYIWPPGLTFARAQQSLEAPLLGICVLGFFPHIHAVQTILFLSAAGPVFPDSPVLVSLGCSCLADGVGDFFPAPNKASAAAAAQPSAALLLLVTTAREAPHQNLSPMPAPPSDVVYNNSELTSASGSVIW